MPTIRPTSPSTVSLRQGDRDSGGSTAVKDMQTSLNAWRTSHGRSAIVADGNFGSGTAAAVRDFQQATGATADGIVGAQTRAKLDSFSTDSTPTPNRPTTPVDTMDNGRGPLPGAPKSYDVGSISNAQLSALPASMQNTIREARSTYARELAANPPAKLSVLQSQGNGGAPVLTIQSGQFDPSRPATVQTHYHGWRTSVGHSGGSHTANIKANLNSDPQRVFVLPECRSKNAQGQTDWSNATNQMRTTSDAMKAMGISSDARQVVSAHSAGGKPLAGFMANGTLKADQVRMLDCLYWSDSMASSMRAHPGRYPDVQVIVSSAQTSQAAQIARTGAGVRTQQVRTASGWSAHESTVTNNLR